MGRSLELYHERRKAWFADKSCAVCGSREGLVLDHKNPSEKAGHQVWTWTEVSRERELAKCQALCVPCHRLKTNRENGYNCVHGTWSMYTNDSCRCTECKAAAVAHERKRREAGYVRPSKRRTHG